MAQDSAGEQQRLYQRMVANPTNYDITSAYVRAAIANGDYEAAIGALERLLFYNPNLAHVKYELGTLYYRLGAYEMARRYFHEAQASPALDEATRQSITAYLENANQATQQSRFSGFAQTGLRYQSNANFGPAGDVIRYGGANVAVSGSAKRAPDWNWFGVVGLSHDYDLEDQRGDVLETRFIAYDSQQFKLHDLDVGLFDVSFGPRMPLATELLPGSTIKPYIVGGNTWVGTARYLTSGGAGLQIKLPLGKSLTVGPEFEWRNVNYNPASSIPTDTFATGNMFTGGMSAQLTISDQVKVESKGYYRRGLASNSFQTYDQWVAEAALTLQLPPLVPNISSSASPFGRYIRTKFDAANPYIDPLIARTDDEWIAGITFNTQFSKAFGVSTTIQYDRVGSTLPNYREDNFSVMAGPTAHF
ncbi:MAG TPA: tetratricopeptide repeat protein [Pseudolabrys sp.]|jgi:tetratricopeptide (TPR) repeat protein|nr:tetratricopeptide repeat protein [Pseudolabrys sp.]